MPEQDWDARYRTDDIPWDTGEPDPHLVAWLDAGSVTSGRVLDVGCGTGTNALFLAARGFEVLGVDISARAIALADQKRASTEGAVRFLELDFLRDEVPGGPFDFVFDRGVFHVFDAAADRARFAERVAALLAPKGRWLSLSGSTEGPPRDHGPPRRTARDLSNAIEPVLEIVALRATRFPANLPSPAMAWLLEARARAVPAQPSTGSE